MSSFDDANSNILRRYSYSDLARLHAISISLNELMVERLHSVNPPESEDEEDESEDEEDSSEENSGEDIPPGCAEIPNYERVRDDCSICLDILKGTILKTNCGHLFHKECLSRWYKHKNSCPLCRQPFQDEQESTEESNQL